MAPKRVDVNADVVPKAALVMARLPDSAIVTVVSGSGSGSASAAAVVPRVAMVVPVRKKVNYLCCVNLLEEALV